MNELGRIQIGYLGTDPAVQSSVVTSDKPLDYATMDKEHRRLRKIIKAANKDMLDTSKDVLEVGVDVPTSLVFDRVMYEERMDEAAVDAHGNAIAISATVRFSNHSGGTFNAVNANIDAPSALILSATTIHLPTVPTGRYVRQVTSRIRISKKVFLSSRKVSIITAYTNSSGEPRISTTSFEIPLCLFATVAPPVRNAQFVVSFYVWMLCLETLTAYRCR